MRSTRLARWVVVAAACVAAGLLSPRGMAADPPTHDQILKDWVYPDSKAGFDKQGPALVYHYRASADIGKVVAFYDELVRKTYKLSGAKMEVKPGLHGSSDGGKYVFYLEEAAPGSKELPAASLSVRVQGSREGWTIFVRRIDAEKTRVTLIYDPPQGK